METPADRLARARDAMEAACRAAGREPGSVRLVAVGKTFPAAALEPLHAAGQRDFGENRVQEAAGKVAALPDDIRWHLVGHLQSNKAAEAVRLFQVIHSLDSARLAARVDRLAGEAGRDVEGLVQVDLAGETTKFGVPPDELPGMLEAAAAFEHLRITGLMTLPPFHDDTEEVRPYFARLRELAADMERRGLLGRAAPVELSMGMTHDYPVAISEGATLIRLGTALFGPRV